MPRLRSFKWDEWAEWTDRQIRRDTPPAIAIDTETSGLGFYDEPFCATLTWRGPDGLRSAYISLEGEGAEVRAAILRLVLDAIPTWVFHNAKFDLQKLALADALPAAWQDLKQIEDTATLQHLLNENERKGLKHMAATMLGESTNEDKVLAKVRRKLGLKKDDGYFHIPREYLVPYAIKDTEFTLRLYELLRPRLDRLGAKDPGVLALYDREIDLLRVLLRMEGQGFQLDIPYLEDRASEYGVKVMEGWEQIATITGNPDLNIQSPKQLLEAFAARGVELESTAEKVLIGLNDELAGALLQYRSDKKMHTTYLKALLSEQRDGLVHPWFNATGARTGRMSSGGATN